MKNLDIEELTALCIEWQERLGLSHWRIAVQICRAREMPVPDVQATSDISLQMEYALISILDPVDYPSSPFEQDMEVTLVHELLHIPLLYITDPDRASLEHTYLEAFIERTARLLVALARDKESMS